MVPLGGGFQGVIWDWGDTLMRDIPCQAGPMVQWPRVEAMPGAAEALEALAEIPVHCVATNAQDSRGEEVAEALARVGLRKGLTHFLTSGELGVAKPDPAFFRRVAEILSIPPSGLLSIGNHPGKDILPARAVGMATILVASDLGDEEAAGVDLVVPDLHHLARIWRTGTAS